MYALRERRVHVTQEDFEMAVAKVMQKDSEKNMSIKKLWKWLFIPFRIKTILEKKAETSSHSFSTSNQLRIRNLEKPFKFILHNQISYTAQAYNLEVFFSIIFS